MTRPPDAVRPRLLLLLPTSTYRAEAFVAAADRLTIDLTVASERPSAFEHADRANLLTLPFDDLQGTVEAACDFARRYPLTAVFGVDDRTALLAAHIAKALALPHNPVPAMEAAADKHVQRRLLADAGVAVPAFRLADTAEPIDRLLEAMEFPIVVKPLGLSASRGVMRADDVDGVRAAVHRLAAILDAVEGRPPSGGHSYLIERYVPGAEYALEGVVDEGVLQVLALFDKPDPLVGPTFAETIYVTPSAASAATATALVNCASSACRALGLRQGPVHIELRHNDEGAWLIELAARPIGGKCGEVLRFGPGGRISLEEFHLSRALGRRLPVERESAAVGVAMLPVPRPGRFAGAHGLAAARSIRWIDRIVITVPVGQQLTPLPEEARYVGFIFARGPDADAVTAALRAARECLDLRMAAPDDGPPA